MSSEKTPQFKPDKLMTPVEAQALRDQLRKSIASFDDHMQREAEQIAQAVGMTVEQLERIGLNPFKLNTMSIVYSQTMVGDDPVFKTVTQGEPLCLVDEPDISTEMSVVSKGWLLDGKKVAVKELAYKHRDDAEFNEAFRREVLLHAALDPEHVIPVIDYLNYEGRQILIMEWAGETLSRRVFRQEIKNLEQVLTITEGIAANLNYLASVGVVHRDIKPANIFLNGIIGDSNPLKTRIGDFGLEKGIRSGEGQFILGTPQYLSPDRIFGTINLDDAVEVEKDDVYTLGLIAYEMISGDPYFSSQRLRKFLKEKDPNKPQEEDSFIARIVRCAFSGYSWLVDNDKLVARYGWSRLKRIDEVLVKALDTEPENRQTTRNELVEELRTAITGKLSFEETLQNLVGKVLSIKVSLMR